jgi:uncharacterized membrane protein
MTKLNTSECVPLLSDDQSLINFGYIINYIKQFFNDWFPLMYLSIIIGFPYIWVLIFNTSKILEISYIMVFLCCLLEILWVTLLGSTFLQLYDVTYNKKVYISYINGYFICYTIFKVYMSHYMFIEKCEIYKSINNLQNIDCSTITGDCFYLIKYLKEHDLLQFDKYECNYNTFK